MTDPEATPNAPMPGKALAEVIKIDETLIRGHLDKVVRESVQETLNALLDAEADQLCGARRYERSPERVDTRAGHYERQLHTKAGEVTLRVPKLRNVPFETVTGRLKTSHLGSNQNQPPCGVVFQEVWSAGDKLTGSS